MSVVITYDGVDITADVEIESAVFVGKVNGAVGTAFIRIRDNVHSYTPITGKRLTLSVDDWQHWAGFGSAVSMAYSFPAEDTTAPGELVRWWEIHGVDDNILFDKRIVFDSEDPATHIDFVYDAGSWDDTIINDLFDNYIDFTGDNITRDVHRVSRAILDIPGVISRRGTTKTLSDFEGTVHTGTIAAAGYTWAQAMDVIQRATGAIYYIRGSTLDDSKVFKYLDAETVSAAYSLSDQPTGGSSVGYQSFEIIENGSRLTNDMLVWGGALGAKLIVFAREQDSASITDHGRWQDGIFSMGLYRIGTANIVADTWVQGTPESKRGRKNDQISFHCRVFQPTFELATVVHVTNSIYGFDANLPLREVKVTFKAPWIAIFDLTLGEEIDQPWSFYETLRKMPRPIEIMRPTWVFLYPPPRICPVPSLELGATGLWSIFQRDFGGRTADPEDPPLWQDPPYGGAWYGSFTGDLDAPLDRTMAKVLPLDPYDDTVTGFIGLFDAARGDLELRSPASGVLEILAAAEFGSGGTSGQLAMGSPTTAFLVTWNAGVDPPEAAASISAPDGVVSTPIDYGWHREPLWIRGLIVPNEFGYGGRYLKVWPRRKQEPLEWTLEAPDGDLDNFDVIHTLGFSVTGPSTGFGGGFEAVSIMAEHGGGSLNFHNYGVTQYRDLWKTDEYSHHAIWSLDNPSDPFDVELGVYFWDFDEGVFLEESYSAVAGTEFGPTAASVPEYGVKFSWPHFGPPGWSPERLVIQNYQQKIVSFDLDFAIPEVGFERKKPESITISGELSVTMGGLFAELGNLPFDVTVSLNYYEFGASTPFYYSYEALPVGRHYVYYNAIGQANPYWVPFEFTFPGEHFQWGVSIVDYLLPHFQAVFASEEPPPGLLTPHTGGVGVFFQNLVYKANYVTDNVGEFFCVETEPHQVDGNAIGLPAWDTGDHLTYKLGSMFVPGSTSVWVNGVVQHYGATEQYTELPGEGKISFNSPLDPDDEVIVDFAGFGAVLP